MYSVGQSNSALRRGVFPHSLSMSFIRCTIWRLIMGLLVVVLFAVGSLQNAHSFSIDAGVYLEIGSQILNGAVPYINLWDHKPPAIYGVNALGLFLFPQSPGAMSLFELIWNLLAGVAFFALVRKFLTERWAWVGTIGLAIFLPLRLLSAGGNTPELYLALPVIVAYLCLITAIHRKQKEASIGREFTLMTIAGIALMLAALFKPTELAHIAVISGVYIYSCFRSRVNNSHKMALIGLLGLATGAIIMLGPVFVYLNRNQALSEFVWQVLVYNSYYVRSRGLLQSLPYLHSFLSLVWPHLLILFILGIVSAAIMIIKRSKRRFEVWILYAWLLVELAGFGLGRRFFVNHFIPAIPALVLLSILALNGLWQAFKEQEHQGSPLVSLRLYFVISLLGLMAMPLITQMGGVLPAVRTLLSGTLFAPMSIDSEQMALVQEIEKRTQPNDPVFIWGAKAGIYFLSERSPASRFIYIFPLLNSFGGLWEGYPAFPNLFDAAPLVSELMTDLRNQPPRLILVEPRFSSYLDRVPVFKTYLTDNYQLATIVDDWQILTKKP